MDRKPDRHTVPQAPRDRATPAHKSSSATYCCKNPISQTYVKPLENPSATRSDELPPYEMAITTVQLIGHQTATAPLQPVFLLLIHLRPPQLAHKPESTASSSSAEHHHCHPLTARMAPQQSIPSPNPQTNSILLPALNRSRIVNLPPKHLRLFPSWRWGMRKTLKP